MELLGNPSFRTSDTLISSNQGTTKLQKFIEEHAECTQQSLLPKLFNKPLEKCHLKNCSFQGSPVVFTINSFENEDTILSQLSQIGCTPEKNPEEMANVLQSKSKLDNTTLQNNFTNKNKKVSRISTPAMQTYKYSNNNNSSGTKKLERFLKEFSQKPGYQSHLSTLNVQNINSENNGNSITKSLVKCTNSTIKNRNNHGFERSISVTEINSSSEKSSSSSKIIRKNKTLLEHFKEIKKGKGAVGKISSPRDFGSVINRRSSFKKATCKSTSGRSSFSRFGEAGGDCARTRVWSKRTLHVMYKENNNKNKNKKYTLYIKDEEHRSKLFKGLNFIEEFNQEYKRQLGKNSSSQASSGSSGTNYGEIKRKSRSQKLDQWLRSNPIQTNNKDVVKWKHTSSENKEKQKMLCKSSFQKSLTTNGRNSQIIKSRTQSGQKLKNSYKQNGKIYKNEFSNKNSITRYFSKDKLMNNRKYTDYYGRKFKRRYSRTEKELNLSEDELTNNTAVAGCNMKCYNLVNNIDVWENRNKEFRKIDEKQKSYYVQNFKETPTKENKYSENLTIQGKSQKNLYSSEGFFESMSLETPKLETKDYNINYLSPKCTEKDQISQAKSYRQIVSSISPRKSRRITRCDENFKEYSNIINLLSSESQSLLPKPQRKKLTLSEERELSPDYYVMKMCGPESHALVQSILNQNKNLNEENSFNSNKTEVKDLSDSLHISNFPNTKKSLSQNEFSKKEVFLNTINKNSPSDPLSFGSSCMAFSGNINRSQINNSPGIINQAVSKINRNCDNISYTGKDKRASNHIPSRSHLDEITRLTTLNRNQGSQRNSQTTQKNKKICGQALDSLCKLHKSCSWNTPRQAQNMELFQNKNSLEKDAMAAQHLLQINQTSKDNSPIQPDLAVMKLASKDATNSHAPLENSISSEIFATQDFSVLPHNVPREENKCSITKTNDKYISTGSRTLEIVDHSANPCDNLFLYKMLTKNCEALLNGNYDNFKPEGSEDHKNTETVQLSQNSVGDKLENCEPNKFIGCHNQINYEELEKVTQTENLTEDIIESQVETQNVSKKLRKTYNITKDCILYENNLLNSLIEDKENVIWKTCLKKNSLKKSNCEEPLIYGRNYIKRYKKGNTKIFKIKRRIKKNSFKEIKPPDGQIMERFLKNLDNNFKESSSTSGSEKDSNLEYVSTPTSYKTDETKSEVLSTGSSKLTDTQKLLRKGINKLCKDKLLLFSKFEDSVPDNVDKYEIITNIEHILNGVLKDFERGKNPYFRVPKENISNCFFIDGRYQMKQPPDYTTISYKSAISRQKFNLMLFLFTKIKKLLETDTKLTKREIYYQLKTMIKSQGTTDRALKDISRMLNVGLWALNVTAQKGLVYGNLNLVMADGETINCNVPGTLVPQDVSKICEVQSTAYFILVVEKESIFHKLLEENLPNSLTRPFILITGKGFPDLNTQLFLKKLWMVMSIPVFILVDADPDGIAIMLNYRFGSIVSHAHVSQHLAIPKARWLGVFPSEISRLNLTNENLSKREISMTQKLLQLECVQENEKLKIQLETLLENGIKAGIEGLIKSDRYLSNSYLSWKFFTNSLI